MSLKASWVNRLVSNQLVNWKVIPCKYFAKKKKRIMTCIFFKEFWLEINELFEEKKVEYKMI